MNDDNRKKSASETSFFKLALSKQVLPRAVKVSLVVGTLLAFINHGEKIITMSLTQESLLKIALTFLVPYCVSTWSAVKALKTTRTNSSQA